MLQVVGCTLATYCTSNAQLTPHAPCPLRPSADFAANAKCSGNTLSLCGTFANNSMANKLYNDFTVNLVGPNALALIGVGDQTFCDQYPSSLITVRSSAYPGQIGYSWGPDCYRQRAIDQCTLGTVDYTATCPAPECNVCWKWSIYGSQDYYYGDQACFMAMVGPGNGVPDSGAAQLGKWNVGLECGCGWARSWAHPEHLPLATRMVASRCTVELPSLKARSPLPLPTRRAGQAEGLPEGHQPAG